MGNRSICFRSEWGKGDVTKDPGEIRPVTKSKGVAAFQFGAVAEEIPLLCLSEHDGSDGNLVFGNIRQKTCFRKALAGEKQAVGIDLCDEFFCQGT